MSTEPSRKVEVTSQQTQPETWDEQPVLETANKRGWGVTDTLGHLPGLSMSPKVQTNSSLLCFHVSNAFHESWLCTTNPMECILTLHGHTAHLTSVFSGNFSAQTRPSLDLSNASALSPAQHNTVAQAALASWCCRALSTHPTAQASLKGKTALGGQREGSASPSALWLVA